MSNCLLGIILGLCIAKFICPIFNSLLELILIKIEEIKNIINYDINMLTKEFEDSYENKSKIPCGFRMEDGDKGGRKD